MTGRKQKLTRPRTGRMLSGVCAGLANFFGLDVSLVRIVYTFATIFTAFAGIPIRDKRLHFLSMEAVSYSPCTMIQSAL